MQRADDSFTEPDASRPRGPLAQLCAALRRLGSGPASSEGGRPQPQRVDRRARDHSDNGAQDALHVSNGSGHRHEAGGASSSASHPAGDRGGAWGSSPAHSGHHYREGRGSARAHSRALAADQAQAWGRAAMAAEVALQEVLDQSRLAHLLSELPRDTYDVNRHKDLIECEICLVEYEEGDELIRLPCLHLFHVNCVSPWLKKSKSCPVCQIDTLEVTS
eukprot:TRINITY_DN56882_c0_g1_i1.p1 TRINITY_DN56882_c0_g1~~TRINITY_DN56882_c0_g1_i1.p1  ORF type:complete len:248 (-),score=28.12 TRINITY_DN56882_c0_g1_i1:157-813(-)